MSKEIKEKKFGRLYLESYKREVIRQIQEAGSTALVCARLGLSRSTVSRWLTQYGGEAYQIQKKHRRSPEERRRIAREIVSGKLTVEDAQLKYGVACRDTITLWVRQYRRSHQDLLKAIAEDPKPAAPQTTAEALRLAELKVRALEMMLDIASTKFNVDIRKKYGAKQ